jgi:hypothetical protein
MGTQWELENNIKKTCWEQMKNEKYPSPTPPSPKNFDKKIKAP